ASCPFEDVLDDALMMYQLIHSLGFPMSSFPSTSGAKRPPRGPLQKGTLFLRCVLPRCSLCRGLSEALADESYCSCVMKLLRGDRTAGDRLSSPQLLPQPCGLPSTLTSGRFRAPAGTIRRIAVTVRYHTTGTMLAVRRS